MDPPDNYQKLRASFVATVKGRLQTLSAGTVASMIEGVLSNSMASSSPQEEVQHPQNALVTREAPQKRVYNFRSKPILTGSSSETPFTPRPRKVPSECVLHRIPVEVREMIFSLALKWEGKPIPLITALRQEPALYQEALRVLQEEHFYVVTGDSDRWKEMSTSTIRGIGNLRLQFLFVTVHTFSISLFANAFQGANVYAKISCHQTSPRCGNAEPHSCRQLTTFRHQLDAQFDTTAFGEAIPWRDRKVRVRQSVHRRWAYAKAAKVDD
jgi:hypothetical protein